MASIAIKNLNNETVGDFELLDDVFSAPVNEELLWEAVRHYTASQRRGTHKTKGRAEVSGAGRKLWKQKGTGRARIGSIRSPLWRHGGTVHGPQPRSYAWKMPHKKMMGALRSALAAKYRDQELVVVNDFELSAPKTKLLRQGLDRLEVKKSALLLDGAGGDALERSARNLPDIELMAPHLVHPFHLLRYHHLVVSRSALEKLQQAARPHASKSSDERRPVRAEKKAAPATPEAAKPAKPKGKAAPKATGQAKPAAKKPGGRSGGRKPAK